MSLPPCCSTRLLLQNVFLSIYRFSYSPCLPQPPAVAMTSPKHLTTMAECVSCHTLLWLEKYLNVSVLIHLFIKYLLYKYFQVLSSKVGLCLLIISFSVCSANNLTSSYGCDEVFPFCKTLIKKNYAF